MVKWLSYVRCLQDQNDPSWGEAAKEFGVEEQCEEYCTLAESGEQLEVDWMKCKALHFIQSIKSSLPPSRF